MNVRKLGHFVGAGVLLLGLTITSYSPLSGMGRSDAATMHGRFSGIHLTVIGAAGQIEAAKKWTDLWARQTGGTVTVTGIPFSDIDSKVLTASGTGTFLADVYNIGAQTAGQLMASGDVLQVPQSVRGRLQLGNIPAIYSKYQLYWNGKMYGLPWDGDMLTYYYRKDLFTDPKYRAAFKAQFHYNLAVPKTWEQYDNIAQFFTGKNWAFGKPGYGLVELMMRQNHLWSGFFSRAASYAKYPGDPDFFFNARTMQANINNPGFLKALQTWVMAKKWGPPNETSLDWSGNATTFIGGKAAQDIQWGDIGPMSIDPKQSLVQGKVGFGVNPGEMRVWNSLKKTWVTMNRPNVAPFAGFGGWINVVPKLTKHAAAAFDLASFLGRPVVRNDMDLTSGAGVNPDSLDALNNIAMWVKSGFTRSDAVSYTNSIKASLFNPNLVFDLRIPGIVEYKDALETELSRVLAGQEAPKTALDKVASEWNAITNRHGRAQQLRYYRESLGLPPLPPRATK